MTTRIITFLVENPFFPLFATVTGKGPHPMNGHLEGVHNPRNRGLITIVTIFSSGDDPSGGGLYLYLG